MFKGVRWLRATSIVAILFAATAALADGTAPDPLADPVGYLLWRLGGRGVRGG
jgi:hypothetical protein